MHQRNQLKLATRAKLPAILNVIPKWRNRLKYGNSVGPTLAQRLQAKRGDPIAVIVSAGKTGARLNRLLRVK